MYRALIVCNAGYVGDPDLLPPLIGPRTDHRLIAEALAHGQFGMFADVDMTVLLDVTAGELQRRTHVFFASAEPDDVLLFYFSGHGATKNHKFYLCGTDTEFLLLAGTAVPDTLLNEIMSDSSARAKIVVLDCCHSGAFKGSETPGLLGGRGRFVLTATAPAQLADDADEDGKASPFTRALAEGITHGAIDEDDDGFVSLEDLYKYVDSIDFRGPKPSRLFDGYGRLPIARRPKVEPEVPRSAGDFDPSGTSDFAVHATSEVADDGPGFLDHPTKRTPVNADRVSRFRGDLRKDIAQDLPGQLSSTEFLQRASLMRDGWLTIAGALLFGEEPTAVVATAIVQCARVYGTSIDDPKDKTDLRGTVPEQIERARDFIAAHTRTGEAPSEHAATTQPHYEYPMIAVRELIANALVHRSYTHKHACVHVKLFEDRLEITNPGSWFGDGLAENHPTPISRVRSESQRRNFRLASVLTWARLVEGEGSGIPATIADCRNTGAPEPTVVQRNGLVTVTLYPRKNTVRVTGDVVAGNINASTYYHPGRQALTFPTQIGVVPPQAESFQPRRSDAALTALMEADGVDAGRPSAVVLSGIGGVGKTQAAAQVARRRWSHGGADLVVWVDAGTRSAIIATYARAAAELSLADAAQPEEAAQTFLAWLETTDKRWLIVLDDVASPGDLRGLWPPTTPSGRTVVTTRRRDAALTGVGRHLVSMDVFTESESVQYLTAKLADHGLSDSPTELAGLAADLGHLPLALSQAVAFMIDRNIGCAAYRRRLADMHRSLAELAPDLVSLPDDQSVTLGAAWSLSIEHADALRPVGLARPMLELVSQLDPTGIPIEVLTADPALEYLTLYRSSVTRVGTPGTSGSAQVTVSEGDALAALRCLARLSLVTADRHSPYETVTVHRLVQRATRDAAAAGRTDSAAEAVARALLAVWPDDASDSLLAHALRANTEHLRTVSGEALWASGSYAVLIRAATSLGQAGQTVAAASFFESIADEAISHLGSAHPDTLSIRANRAVWQAEAGDAAGAGRELERLVDDCARVLGREHPDTLAVRLNLARFKGPEYDTGSGSLESLVGDFDRLLGPDHPDTLTARANLAMWRGIHGDPSGAAVEFQRLFSDRVRLQGPDHPDTLATRSSLASWRGAAGDPAGAARETAELLHDYVRILGPDHRDTLNSRGNLASWRGVAGDPAGAAAQFEELMGDYLRVLGPAHPDTLVVRGNLAFWQGEAGDPVTATAALETLLEDRSRLLGPDHPDTLATRNNLAKYRGLSGDIGGAVTALEQLLADRIRVLGPEHPLIGSTREHLIHWRARSSAR
ncbi:tetratricopeptide repeat protein [Streptomyces kebangsaanensis]|uniref:tetratricopeptide repeat protein n=1 Tax=Streptomyces kebangsaanensis TaxID=864058 RepID=UPI00093B0221|nr:tetratricopeptide repeat protein [Streptomyces kebangsaanensis]